MEGFRDSHWQVVICHKQTGRRYTFDVLAYDGKEAIEKVFESRNRFLNREHFQVLKTAEVGHV